MEARLNSARSEPDRPHLTTNNSLLGTGRFADPPRHDSDYRRGYLCGLIRGDGHLKRYDYPRQTAYGFRLALTDFEALRRAQRFLEGLEIQTYERLFAAAAGNHREMRCLRSGARATFDAVSDLIGWPRSPNHQWRKGFLAGIFDAEGSCGGANALRITNQDGQIIHYTQESLDRLGFDTVVEPPRPNGCLVVRIRGGLKERLRFFHLTDPAITRKRTSTVSR